MNKKFTKLIAALALLVFMAPNMVGWADDVTLTSQQIKAGTGSTSYGNCSATDGDGNTWNAYAIKNQHSNATSDYHFWQIKKYASNTAYYVQVPELGTKITSITMTVSSTSKPMGGGENTATLYFSNSNSTSSTGTGVVSGTGASSVTIDCSSLDLNTGYITASGAVRIWEVSVTYTAGSLEDSDLAITGAPVALSFDLYNNASAQTVSYTTSSTGEVTITPATSNYFTYEHNATAKTITVTPTAVTPSAQTITISQAADGTYKAGEVSFTVEVANSTPTTTVTINDSGITNTDVYVGTAAGSLSATVTYDNSGTPAAVPGATVTWSGDNDAVATIASDGTVTLVGAGTVNFTASYAGAAGQYMPSSATYEMTVTSSAPYVQPTTIEANLNNSLFGTEYTGTVSGITDENPVVGTLDNVTITYAGSGNHYINNSQIRFYPNNKLTFEAPEGYEITQIVFTSDGTWTATISADNGTYTSSAKTWTGSAASVLFTGSGSSVRCDMSKATITLAQLAPKHTLTITMSNVADFTVFVGDETVSGPDPENPSPTVQVSAGTTVGVSIGGMENCYLFGSLTVNGSTAGVTQDDPDDPYFEFTMPDEDAEIDVTTTDATPFTLTVVGMDNVSFDMYMGYNSTEVTITDGTASICEQMHVTIANLTANSGLLVQSVTVTDGTGQPITVNQEGSAYVFNMPSSNATLTFTTVNAPTYTLATSIESGKSYIIVGFDGDDAYAMGEQRTSNNRAGVSITVDGNTATGNANVHEVVITALEGDDDGKYTIEDGGYLYASSSSSNQLKTKSELDNNGKWTIVIANNGDATITAQGSNTRKLMRFNPNDGNPLFSCYKTDNTNGSLPRLYVKDGYTLPITAHTDNGGWNLIASPVAVNPATVEGMVVESTDPNYSNFDLYYFDQTGGQNGKEWKNYKANHFDLELGKGYLYANANTVDLTFTGEMNDDFEDVDNLPYVAGNTIQSLYLAGNSKTTAETFYVYNEELVKQTVNFLTLNGTGDGFVTSETDAFTAQALQGFFVQSGGTGWILSTADMEDGKSGTPELLNIMVNQNRGTLVDNAIVSFSNAPMMSKFYLNDNSTRVYIPQNGEDMAVVRSEAQGEMPVNFKAKENGTYTLSIAAENVEMNYLHLIDNMTGMDIDLLQTPSYTFEATTRDYESRFRLVFAANNNNEDGPSTGSGTFAFYSNGSWIINNAGEATLQVIDLTGRILISETVNGSVSTTLNATPGVYMLRLINGENVNVQKIVVR